jgi:hypothetical protein
MIWKARFDQIKYGLATILAETMENLAPSLLQILS